MVKSAHRMARASDLHVANPRRSTIITALRLPSIYILHHARHIPMTVRHDLKTPRLLRFFCLDCLSKTRPHKLDDIRSAGQGDHDTESFLIGSRSDVQISPHACGVTRPCTTMSDSSTFDGCFGRKLQYVNVATSFSWGGELWSRPARHSDCEPNGRGVYRLPHLGSSTLSSSLSFSDRSQDLCGGRGVQCSSIDPSEQ